MLSTQKPRTAQKSNKNHRGSSRNHQTPLENGRAFLHPANQALHVAVVPPRFEILALSSSENRLVWVLKALKSCELLRKCVKIIENPASDPQRLRPHFKTLKKGSIIVSAAIFSYITSGRAWNISSCVQMPFKDSNSKRRKAPPRLPISMNRPPGFKSFKDRPM